MANAATRPEAGGVETWTVPLGAEADTLALARLIAEELKAGDCVALSGGLGAGKTVMARALVRELAGDPGLEVPSPTFTLMQLYETSRAPVVHADFYRIGGAEELGDIGFEEATAGAVTLVEWPERAPSALPGSRLEIRIELKLDGSRVATLLGLGGFGERLARMRAVRTVLAQAGWSEARRRHMQGDASTRLYERLEKAGGETAVLMISPPRPDGPPVRRGKPYSVIAKLAETVHAFVALDRGLRALSLSAPRILGEDLDAGLLLLEDLGGEPVVGDEGPIPERYAEAARVLAKLHNTSLPNVLPVSDGREHVLPPYDLEAFLIEAELLLDWYLPHILSVQPSGSARAEFVNLWTEALAEAVEGPSTWTLRDYHSPNLIWLPERSGLERVGLIDFQDAVLGPPAYDVASLLQDARVDLGPDLELRLLGIYAKERRAGGPAFDLAAFARVYAVMGAQRATKILGIFARLDRRDGKPQYLRHLPRMEAILARNLAHPALARLSGWFATHLPALAALRP